MFPLRGNSMTRLTAWRAWARTWPRKPWPALRFCTRERALSGMRSRPPKPVKPGCACVRAASVALPVTPGCTRISAIGLPPSCTPTHTGHTVHSSSVHSHTAAVPHGRRSCSCHSGCRKQWLYDHETIRCIRQPAQVPLHHTLGIHHGHDTRSGGCVWRTIGAMTMAHTSMFLNLPVKASLSCHQYRCSTSETMSRYSSTTRSTSTCLAACNE